MPGLNFEEVENTLGGLATLPDGGNHQVGTAHHIAAGKYFRVGGLELERLDFPPRPRRPSRWSALRFPQPLGRIGLETEGDDNGIRLEYKPRCRLWGGGRRRPSTSGSPILVFYHFTPQAWPKYSTISSGWRL